NTKAYSVSGGRFGMGAAVVNALCEWLEIEVRRDGKRYRQRFDRGHASSPPEIVEDEGSSSRTKIRFLLDRQLLRNIDVDPGVVQTRLWELACLVPRTKMAFVDEPTGQTESHLNESFAQSTERFLQYC